jgi:hypothetical protein
MDRRRGINTALKSQKSALLGSRSQLGFGAVLLVAQAFHINV